MKQHYQNRLQKIIDLLKRHIKQLETLSVCTKNMIYKEKLIAK